MDQNGLNAFKAALKAVVEGVSAADTLASVDKIRGLLIAHGLNETALIDRFTKPIKKS